MDELLHDRVQQLREIDERLERIERLPAFDPTGQLRSLRLDLARMIAVAEGLAMQIRTFHWAVVDNLDLGFSACPECGPRFVRTNGKSGLNHVSAQQIIDVFVGQAQPEQRPAHEWSGGPLNVCIKCETFYSVRETAFACDPSKLAGKVENCCDCGDEYPRSDLLAGHIYCQKCRATASPTIPA